MPIPRPSKDDYLYPSDAGIMGEDYRLDQLRFKEAPVEKEHDAVVKEAEREAAERARRTGEAQPVLVNLADVEPTPKRSKPYMDDTPEPEGAETQNLPYLGARVRQGLAKLGVITYKELASLTTSDVLACKNLGDHSLKRLRNVLASRGLSFLDESIDGTVDMKPEGAPE